MRLRLILPRRGRRAGLGGLAAALVLLAGCGGGDEPRRPAPAPVPRFAIGIDEKNPHLLAPGEQPAPFARFRDALAALEPSYVRVLVDWSTVQKSADAPPVFDERKDGCARGAPPCAPFDGIRDTLRAVAALGARPVVLIYGTPDWAANGPEGCETEDARPYSRMPDLAAYRTLVRAIVALARDEDVEIAYLSPWNEPNLPIFLNPQRAACDLDARPLSPVRYAQLARVAAGEVGLDRLLVGEAAGISSHTNAVGAAELARALPDDLVCGAAGWAQHAYVTAPLDQGRDYKAVPLDYNAGILRDVEAALDAHGCDHTVPVWITETGAGGRPGACEDMAAQLRAWRADPRIRAAFQYTLRDDPIFPAGLADAGLTRLYPTYAAWRSRGDSCGGRSGGRHGTVIGAESIAGGALPDSGRSRLVRYRSTWPDGAVRETTGVVTVPDGPPPPGGFPVVAWGHPTIGIADACAPSSAIATEIEGDPLASLRAVTSGWVRAGYAVVQTDYQGLGTPGRHPYLVGVSEGRGMADLVLAARDLDERVGRDWAAVGHSQGGHAALWAAAIGSRYAPGLRLRGAVALAPASHVAAAVRDGAVSGAVPALVLAAAMDAAGVEPATALIGTVRERWPLVDERCAFALEAPEAFGGLTADDLLAGGFDAAPLYGAIAASDPEHLTVRVPLLVAQGVDDDNPLTRHTAELVAALRRRGATVTEREYAGVDHVGVLPAAIADVDAFLATRLRRA